MAKKVFVVNEPKGNRSLLGRYGEIMHLVDGWVENKDLDPALRSMIAKLERFYVDGDLVVFGGHAKLNMVAFHWIMSKHKIVRQLMSHGDKGWALVTHDGRDADGEWYIPS